MFFMALIRFTSFHLLKLLNNNRFLCLYAHATCFKYLSNQITSDIAF
jgi:hypothetical protein